MARSSAAAREKPAARSACTMLPRAERRSITGLWKTMEWRLRPPTTPPDCQAIRPEGSDLPSTKGRL